MGGKNHQPTHPRVVAVSAWLSQKVGEGFQRVIEANGYLEDAIILGFEKLHVEELARDLTGTPPQHLRKCLGALAQSSEALVKIDLGFRKLADACRIEGYTGNPLAAQLRSFDLRTKFEGGLIRPVVNTRVWEELENRIADGNILKTLEWERQQFEQLRSPTDDLRAVLLECLAIAESMGGRAFVDAVEHNELPLRQHYAQVFSLWNNLDAMFLYSALMMTELFYRASAYPSLVEFKPTAIRAA